jgi:hypothetical protein
VWIEEEMGRTEQSKTQVIAGALEEVRRAQTSRGRHSRCIPEDLMSGQRTKCP